MRCELTILMPCLNECETLGQCVVDAQDFLRAASISGEVLVADNGSTDGSQDIALANGARVVCVSERGYGAALRGGIAEACGDYVIMGDADSSYDFKNLGKFVDQLRAGADLVIGNRFQGGIDEGAMPFLHKYLGNPILSFIGRLFFKIKIGDFHCGLRGFVREKIVNLNLHTSGMEFASEMIVSASLANYNLVEVPTRLRRDGRLRPPHLRTWRDGWRHLSFLLAYSPNWLFLYPGIAMIILGLFLGFATYRDYFYLGRIGLGMHTFLAMNFLVLLGVQCVFFSSMAKIIGGNFGLFAKINPFELRILRNGNNIISFGLIIFSLGLFGSAYSVYEWAQLGFGEINNNLLIRKFTFGLSASLLGIQIILTMFLIKLMSYSLKISKY